MVAPPTGTITFLFTDIQGSTRLWERSATKMQAALVRHDEILRSTVADHGGHVFKMVGDACYAAFASAPDALKAALAAQQALFSEPWDEECRIRVRMALHTGSTEHRGGDYFGPPLNRVARLLSAGHGGQTLLSRTTKDLVENSLPEGASLQDMGERRLKDLKEPEHIFQILATGLPQEFPPLKTLETTTDEDRYRLIRQIGSGGMAEVYLAYDEFLEREVAFKVLDRKYAKNKEAIERFRREARNAAPLHHPHIVATHDRGETEDGTYYIVMEYLDGGTLEDLISEHGPLAPREAAEIAAEIADALRVAHESGVIHRDIKPQNILLSSSGEAKVADFGIARAATATTMTQAGSILGTVHYISPEQALGETATFQSDLYSLGVVLYEMLTGELPYDAETPVGIVMKHVGGLSRSPKEANPDVPEELDTIVGELLARDPEERYPDAVTLVEDLEGACEALPEVERARGAMAGTGPAGRRGTRSPGSRTPGTSGRVGTGGGLRISPSRTAGGGLQLRGILIAAVLVLLSLGIIGFVAMRGGGSEVEDQGAGPAGAGTASTQSETGAKTIPEWEDDEQEPPPLPAGTYVTEEFEPTVSFEVGKGWHTTGEYKDSFEILPPTDSDGDQFSGQYSSLGVSRVDRVYDPGRQGDIKVNPENNKDLLSPVPDDLIGWLQQHPYLKTSEPEPVTVGGRQGTQIDIEVSPVPERYSTLCGDEPCVVLAESDEGAGGLLFFPAGGKNRLTVLRDVEGATVLIHSNAFPTAAFDDIISKNQKVIDTFEWVSTTASASAIKDVR